MPTSNSDGSVNETPIKRHPRFRDELQDIRALVINHLKECSDMETVLLTVHVVSSIDRLEENLDALAKYIREGGGEERQKERDREMEIQNARNTY